MFDRIPWMPGLPHHPPVTTGRIPPALERSGRIISRVLLLAAAALVASCIDGHEEYWIDSHGGGRAEIRYSIPESFARMEGGDAGIRKIVSDFLKETPAITSSEYDVVTANKVTTVTLHAKFDSALKLAEVADGPSSHNLPAAAHHLLGEIKAETKGRTVELTRTTTPAQAIPGSTWMPLTSFEGNSLTYIVHLPNPAVESDATRTADDGRTLIWEIPLEKTLTSPAMIHFKMEIPIPWKIMGAVAITLAILIGAWFLRSKKRKSTEKCPAGK
jgi:hypothetical protein